MGICGVIQIDGAPRQAVPPDVLRRMTDAMAHRGPDDAGFHEAPGVAFGARRLSIVDVEGGHQPFGLEEPDVWAMQNGEIFNHQLLREGLERDGFCSARDATPRCCRRSTRGTASTSRGGCAACSASACGMAGAAAA